jgi:hypothetical protein
MNTIRIAVVMVRLVGLQFLFGALINIAYFPRYHYSAHHARSANGLEYAHLELGTLMLVVALHLLIGLSLCLMARPVARMLADGLLDDHDALADA